MSTQPVLTRAERPARALPQGPLRVSRFSRSLEGLGTGTVAVRLLQLPEESMVPDARAGLTPSQMVDQRLDALLGHGAPA